MLYSRITNILGSLIFVIAVAGLAYAFTGPTYGPGHQYSSSGSYISQMAGPNFNPETDSLSKIKTLIDSLGGGSGGGYWSYNRPPEDGKGTFLLSNTTTGNMGGIAGAHALCQADAERHGLSGTYKAWIASSASDDPESTHTHHTVPYYEWCPGCARKWAMLARDWSDLTDGSLLSKFNYTLDGTTVTTTVFTNVNTDGTVYSDAATCNSFAGTTGQTRGGNSAVTDSTWTDINSYNCTVGARLYCFEQ